MSINCNNTVLEQTNSNSMIRTAVVIYSALHFSLQPASTVKTTISSHLSRVSSHRCPLIYAGLMMRSTHPADRRHKTSAIAVRSTRNSFESENIPRFLGCGLSLRFLKICEFCSVVGRALALIFWTRFGRISKATLGLTRP